MADPNAVIVANPDLTAAVVQISSFLSHVSVSGASAHLLEWVKNHPTAGKFWALLSKRGKVIVGAVVAGAGSLGITATFQHDPHAQAGVYTILVTGLTGPTILQHAWSFVQSWWLQQSIYSASIQPRPVTGVIPQVGQSAPEPVVVTGTGAGNPG